jgi:hypothetical protein
MLLLLLLLLLLLPCSLYALLADPVPAGALHTTWSDTCMV